MQHRAREVVGEARQVLDQPADAEVAERDLALELADVGHVDRRRRWRRRRRACRCRAAAPRRPRPRGRCRGRWPRSPTPTGRPRGSARAARGGRPGGSTWPPARRGTPPTSRVPSPKIASSSARRCGFWIVRDEARADPPPSGRPSAAGPSVSASRSTSCGSAARSVAHLDLARRSAGGRCSARRRGRRSRCVQTLRDRADVVADDRRQTTPVRSASPSLRYSPPSRLVRSLRSRTSRTMSMSCPSVSWLTSTVRNARPAPGG